MQQPQSKTQTERLQASAYDYLAHYMDEYYPSLTQENMTIGLFLSTTMARAAAGREVTRMLDVACGPSAYYWALTESAATEVHCLDIRNDSMDYLQSVIEAASSGNIEPRYFEVAEHFAPHGDTHRYARDVANAFKSFVVHDISEVWPYMDASFEAVVSCFGMDHVESEEQFEFVLAEAYRVLAPGGHLNLATLCETTEWRSGDTICSCLYTDAVLLHSRLLKVGFRLVELKEVLATTAIEQNQGYTKMIFCQAVKI